MNAATQVKQQYLKSTVMSATPEQLHLMLLDGAIRFAARGREALLSKDYEGMFNSLDRAQRIALELSAGLNSAGNPELVSQMVALYEFIYRQLVNGSLKREASSIDDALRILRMQRETWQIIVDKIQREAPKGTAVPEASPHPGGAPSAFVADG